MRARPKEWFLYDCKGVKFLAYMEDWDFYKDIWNEVQGHIDGALCNIKHLDDPNYKILAIYLQNPTEFLI